MASQRFSYKNLIIFILFVFLFSSMNSMGQPIQNFEFKHLSEEDGLSQGNITSIFKDSRGFMWFTTYDGLNKYDGYKFSVYKNNPKDPFSISSNFNSDIFEDDLGYLWIATSTGANRFDPTTEKFLKVPNKPFNNDNSSDYAATNLIQDKSGNIWIGTFSQGLRKISGQLESEHCVYSTYYIPLDDNSTNTNQIFEVFEDSKGRIWVGAHNQSIFLYNPNSNDFESFSLNGLNRNVGSMTEDQQGNIWCGGDDGVTKISSDLSTLEHYGHSKKNINSLSPGKAVSVYCDSKNQIWVGTQTALNLFDANQKAFIKIRHDPINPYSMSKSEVWSIFEDNQNNIWIGTFTGGINIIEPSSSIFNPHRHSPLNSNSLGGPSVTSFFQEEDGKIWIGLDHDGLDLFDPKTGEFQHFKANESANSLSGNSIMAIHKDTHGFIWFGTYMKGITRYDKNNNEFKHYNADNPSSGLSDNVIMAIEEDQNQTMWFGTNGGGLNKYDRQNDSFTSIRADYNDSTAMSNDYVWTVLADKENNLWIGTSYGLNKLNQETGEFSLFLHADNDSTSIGSNSIQTLYEDKSGTLWVGTQGSGFSKYNQSTNDFKNFSEINGFSSNNILSIVEDNGGNLWFGTYNGLSKFNSKTESFKIHINGLQSAQFNHEAGIILNDGRLAFGGINGFNLFHPDSIRENGIIPPIVITDFQIFNKSKPEFMVIDSINDMSNIYQTIHMTHEESVFSFEFASLNFSNPELNQYAYILEGFEESWNYGNASRRFATYTNLPPGNYNFKIKGSNNDGYWNDQGASVPIVIHPPWWDTVWFKILLTLSIFGMIWVIYLLRVDMIYKQKEALEKEVEKRASEILHQKEELENQAKMLQNFNHDISAKNKMLEDLHREKDGMIGVVAHDLRSPLHKIKGFTTLIPMVGSLTKLQENHLKQIDKLIEQGNILISDLLYVNGIDQFEISLTEDKIDIIAFVQEWLKTYEQDLNRKEQKMNLKFQVDELMAATDKSILRRILDNLLSNAIKFSEIGKTIFLKIEDANDRMIISIRDQGPGINEEELPKLFQMFQKINTKPTAGESSTGLGLSIVRALTLKLNGKVSVKSRISFGTTFTVELPKEINLEKNMAD